MSTAQRGRHTEGPDRPLTERRARITVHGLCAALRRVVVPAVVILAVAGASSARTSEAAPVASDPPLTAGPTAEQAGYRADNLGDTDVELVAARALSAQRAPTVARDQLAAAKARSQRLARATAAMARARAASANQVSRAHARQDLLARAQSDPRAVGRLMVAERGWSADQFACLDSLWTKESGWNWSANNSGSGAYGIPQSLPGSKMASAGSDWATNPVTQITWGLQYVVRSYGTPCSAWAHSQAMNWY